jgi:hypothetical protein
MHSMKGIVILKREGLESRIPATEDRWDARCRSFLLAILYIAFFSSPRHLLLLVEHIFAFDIF